MLRSSLLRLIMLLAVFSAAAMALKNGDGSYQQLRNIGFGDEAVAVSNLVLKRDAATFQLNSGTVCFLAPVQGKITGAVFVGEGRMLLTPPMESEERSLSLLTREKEFSENFERMGLRFTDGSYEEIKKAGKPSPGPCDVDVLQDSQHAARKQLHYNLDARVLQDVLSPSGRPVRCFCPRQEIQR